MPSLNAYVCRYCGQADPGEWGTGRRCPEHPNPTLKPYMQECEFCPVPAVERDAVVRVVMELREQLATARDLAQSALDGSHNWLVAQTPTSESTVLGYIPEADPDA